MKKILLFLCILYGCTKREVQLVTVPLETKVIVTDTVTSFPLPTGTGLTYIVYDTVPGFILDSILITDQGDQTVEKYVPERYLGSWVIHPKTPMICSITFYIQWEEQSPPVFSPMIGLYSFYNDHSWEIKVLNWSPHADWHSTIVDFEFIDITKVFTIKLVNHGD